MLRPWVPFLIVAVALASNGASRARTPAEELDPKSLKTFADGLRYGVKLLARNHPGAASEAQMLRCAIEGLYAENVRLIPPEIVARMLVLERAKKEDVLNLLMDARRQLGNPAALRDQLDLKCCFRAIFDHTEPGALPYRPSEFKPPKDCLPMIHFGGMPAGVGVQLAADKTTGLIRVVTPIYGSPAYKAGIRAGDLIEEIRIYNSRDGEPLPQPRNVSMRGMTVEEAVNHTIGARGTKVVLIVRRPTAP